MTAAAPAQPQDADATAAIQAEVETILAGPGAGVVDALVAVVVRIVRANMEAAVERGYMAGRASSEEALRRAREGSGFAFDDFVAACVAGARDCATAEEARCGMAHMLADVITSQRTLQRDIDRAIVLAEVKRRSAVAETYPELGTPARASATLLQFTAGLIEAGEVPEHVAELVAVLQAARREHAEARAAGAKTQEPAGKGKPSRATLRQAKQQALAFLREAQKLEGPGDALPLGAPKVEVLPGGVVGATEIGHREPRTYSAEQAVQLGLALLGAGYEAQTAAGKKGRR